MSTASKRGRCNDSRRSAALAKRTRPSSRTLLLKLAHLMRTATTGDNETALQCTRQIKARQIPTRHLSQRSPKSSNPLTSRMSCL